MLSFKKLVKSSLLHNVGICSSEVVLFLVNFSIVLNKKLGLFCLLSIKVMKYAYLTVLRAFL